MSAWTLARRAERMNPSIIREILKVTEQPGVLSLAGGLPSPESFPVEALREATTRVLRDTPREALQYAASEGYGPLREWVATQLAGQGMRVTPAQVLITTGSQQGLDLVGKVLCDADSRILVETPTYLGALQAFSAFEPDIVPVESDDEGPLPSALDASMRGARFMYVLPNYQNPSGHCYSEARRATLVERTRELDIGLVEDNPYGDLWFDVPPPAALAGRNPEGVVYLGSFSKVLAPGLRLGYVVSPPPLFPKLLQAKQAADLHTPGFNQRIVHEVIREGFLDTHVPQIRARYRAQRDAMAAALTRLMPRGCSWNTPQGGMFFWIRLPAGVDALQLLPRAVKRGVAFVPGSAFYARDPVPNTLRLSFVTLSPAEIDIAIGKLAQVIGESMTETASSTAMAVAGR